MYRLDINNYACNKKETAVVSFFEDLCDELHHQVTLCCKAGKATSDTLQKAMADMVMCTNPDGKTVTANSMKVLQENDLLLVASWRKLQC